MPNMLDGGRWQHRGSTRCATARRLSSGVTLVSPRGCRTKGLPMAKGGVVTSLHHPARFCARFAHSVNTSFFAERGRGVVRITESSITFSVS